VIRVLGLTVALLLLSALLPVGAPRPAEALAIEVVSESAANRFPEGIQFTLFVRADSNITSARVSARVLPDRPTTTVSGSCTTGTVSNCTATLGNTRESYLVPGAEVLYIWELEDASGNKLSTPEQKATYQDDRFQWQSVSEGNLTVFYYFGSDQTPRSVMAAARETIDRIGTLLQTTVDFPVKIWVYQTAQDMSPAVASRAGRGPNSTIRTLGEVGASDTALVSRDVDFLNIVRHEIAHVVTGQATRSHINFPSWINEGISVFSQREILADEKQAIDLAVRRNSVLPITSLGSSAQGSASTVSLFYAQSGALVEYLVETYGDAKFAAWITALRRNTLEGALQEVYGFDTLGLENGWRKSIGLPEVSATGGGSSSNPGSIPTLAPLGSNQGSGSAATPESGGQSAPSTSANETDDDGGSSPVVPIAVGVLAVIALAGGAGYLVYRRRNTPAT
jgi:hypothetical protein